MTDLLKLSNLSLHRGGRALFSGLDCCCRAGEAVVILGPNGAGKSSLLLALAGLMPADGAIEIDGQPLHHYTREERARLIAWQGALPPAEFGLTVGQRLELAAAAGSGDIAAVAERMEIAALLGRALGELSSGERQRTELAALMLRDAPIWLLDEPTAHLDLKHQIQWIDILKTERRQGRAIIAVLHDLQQALAIADALILIDGQGGDGGEMSGVRYGRADSLGTAAQLGELFQAPVIKQGQILLPDYGESV